ncbi:cupin domain-containing protein [Streptomyces sp. NBC_00237]|uniref:cupin domain-containing protein n=1 Tax=Streptomyces sp. NBC_00237 TaxID=2975687 RepID=UPI002250B7ED|nr:cupin domain-containing protein [Streptomyces sp. NBC_00237]MCX5206632.1 cupin domain-containing protein [Streptomyces sp. NBC_00237]
MSARARARVLAFLDECVAAAPEGQRGALWRLAERNRQLDANLVRLLPHASVAPHVEGALDVLLIVVEGEGLLDDGSATAQELRPGGLVWLPRGASRALSAGARGLTYLTVHGRRPGMEVGRRPAGPAEQEGGEPPCALDRVCPGCGRLGSEAGARYCAWCGEELPIAP